MGLILLVILILLLILVLPTWPYSSGWGYQPVSILGVLLIVLLILIFADVINFWDVEVVKENNKTTIIIEPKDNDNN